MTPYFIPVGGASLAQGDLLSECPIPRYPVGFGSSPVEVEYERGDLIVLTQSCDLENKKAPLVAMCPIFTLDELASIDRRFSLASERARESPQGTL